MNIIEKERKEGGSDDIHLRVLPRVRALGPTGRWSKRRRRGRRRRRTRRRRGRMDTTGGNRAISNSDSYVSMNFVMF